MTEQQSLLQVAYDEERDLQTIKILNLCLSECTSSSHETNINIRPSRFAAEATNLTATVFKIEDEAVGGYLPTRVWHDSTQIVLLYYVSKSLPDTVRPFGKVTYAIVIPMSSTDTIVEYDLSLRVFIDQVISPSGEMFYTILFGQEVYDQLIVS